jgi:hypothetical protein
MTGQTLNNIPLNIGSSNLLCVAVVMFGIALRKENSDD